MAATQEQAPAAPPQTASTDNEVALYWDPRYHRYFYAGIMTPPTGQLYDFTGTPITHTTDTHTWSVVELEQEDPFERASSMPILVEHDALGRRKRPSKRRRISWTLFGQTSKAVPAEQGVSVCCRVQNFLCCAIVIVTVLIVLFWLEIFTGEKRDVTRDGATLDADLTNNDVMFVKPFIVKRVHPPTVLPGNLRTAIQGRFFSESGNESASTAD